MVPKDVAVRAAYVDVTAAMEERPRPRMLKVLAADTSATPQDGELDPFADVELPR
jgi:hypothetical protein